jgi:XTP/dITP diphosphohydrolase
VSQLLIATWNPGKFREFRQMLSDLPFAFVSLAEVPGTKPVLETGGTFVENASLKATQYAGQSGLLTLADDSGLEVDALEGAPGVWSARYGGEGASDRERIEMLIAALKSVAPPYRSARFVSVIVLASSVGRVLNTSVGKCEGQIATEPRGTGGFGYDSIFIPAGWDKTFAELRAEIKNRISHRSAALRNTRKFLKNLTHDSAGG